MKRRIVQLVASESVDTSGKVNRTLYALDEDGAAWVIDPYDRDAIWSELPELPDKPRGKSISEML